MADHQTEERTEERDEQAGDEKSKAEDAARRHEDGSISIGGEKVDNPADYKGDPIPGGPTDPNAPKLAGEDDTKGDTAEE